MSLPAEAPTQIDALAGDDSSFTLIVISPSTGVTSPLTFPQLPVITTVSQLKEKLRDALPSQPTNDGQRLIHRGRLLSRDTESMLELFGQEALRSSEPQTLHLVLRPTAPDPPPIPSSAPFATPVYQARPQPTPANLRQIPVMPLPDGFQVVAREFVPEQLVQPRLFPEHPPNLAEQPWQGVVDQRLQELQRETARLHQEMVSIELRSRVLTSAHPDIFNNQREHVAQPPQAPLAGTQGAHISPSMGSRQSTLISVPPPPQLPSRFQQLTQRREGQYGQASAEAQHGIQNLASDADHAPLQQQGQSGRASPNAPRPDHTAIYSREGMGPNGGRWPMIASGSTSTTEMPQNPFVHSNDYPQVPRMHPAATSLQPITGATDRPLGSQRTTSWPNLQNNFAEAANLPPLAATALQPNTFGRTTLAGVFHPQPVYQPQPGTYTTMQNIAPSMNSLNSAPDSREPVVYILSSPQGPQALLINNSETYHSHLHYLGLRQTRFAVPTAEARRQAQAEIQRAHAQAHGQDAAALPELQARAAQRQARRGNRRQPENHPIEPRRAPHGNPGAAALGARMGPIIWLIIRLAGFVWFFTAGNNSWARFLTVTALAFVVFIINTGIFDGVADALWGPVRRHVEGLIPLAGPHAALVPAAHAAVVPPQGQQPEATPPGNGPRPRRRRGELDEAEVAARLLQQQEYTFPERVFLQFRRLEHATLLFLASLVPGVGERHIAAREAAANAAEAERQRQVEAAEAAERSHAENAEGGSEQADGGDQETWGTRADHVVHQNPEGRENRVQDNQAQANPEGRENLPQNTGNTEGRTSTQPVSVDA